ncbi:MAG: FKBP-type peptidyl-prolyl cis-trans isomerase [Phenylobacterium sp.]|uniref:FKBP-type peptidyl-prolyl cis-trans isomerase n=1 Tax=Phenylobacterium sp. TaxID=1871053 RepID=UPI0027302881|nr:FKBP-type peptidyl-prolyl cis-trans isomerase [Phenylobacterium sp.]MDP2009516.1 FKBP-type peptidyl-prolyl cis-trans isomerase [Phenylobacterium sp.]
MKRFVLALALVVLAACGPNKQVAADNLTAANTFLAKNGKAADVVTLPSGLQYKVVQSGPATGAKPEKGDEVKVHYEGKLLDGKVFDSSYERGAPAAMPIDALIPAWIEALQLMRPGDVWMLYVPPELGYGEEGAGGGEIPGNSVLIFKIELIGVLPGPGSVGQG